MTPQSRLADLRQALAGARPPVTLGVGRAALVSPGFAGELAALLAEAGPAADGLTPALPAGQLADGETLARAMRELRAVGVGLALDHAGTGTARLDLLAALPCTAVIVDAAFDEAAASAKNEEFAKAVRRFARGAGIDYRVRYEAALQESAL